MRMALLIAMVCGPLAGCARDSTSVQSLQEVDVFRSNLSVGMTRLRAQYSKLEPQTAERESKTRRLIFDLLGMCEDDSENQALSNAFAALLARSRSFNMYDRNVMWLTGDLLTDHPPGDPAFLVALGRKVENARTNETPTLYKTTYSALAVGFILDRISYDGLVSTHDDKVDYEQFSMLYAWLLANEDKLAYDPEKGLYHPQDPPPPPPDEPETPDDEQEPADPKPEKEPASAEEAQPSAEPEEAAEIEKHTEPSDAPDETDPPARPDPPTIDEMTVNFE